MMTSYSADSSYSLDIDECLAVTCIEGECVNVPGSYHCQCPANHVLHPDNDHFCILGVGRGANEANEEEAVYTRPRYFNPVCGGPVSLSRLSCLNSLTLAMYR